MMRRFASIMALCAVALLGLGSAAGRAEDAAFPMPEGPVESAIFVEPVAGISDDFIRGMDASSVLAEERSGVKYYNEAGEEQDVFMTLVQAGVNYIRLRVWNDPYDIEGRGYGGGGSDLDAAIKLGRRATQYGMKVCVDFHYSDFWADPKRQHAPKAWEGMSAEQKVDALYLYTKKSLADLLDSGVDVGMVQIGNEINNGMAGETVNYGMTAEAAASPMMKMLKAGSRAVREIAEGFGKDIRVVVHYANISQPDAIDGIAAVLEKAELDYDIFGLSYHPFRDGTKENMQAVARNIRDRYGKPVVIAETSYCYTAEDGDGFANTLSGKGDTVDGYPATVQGQANMIRDVCAAANEAGVLGVFYWEGAWIPVGEATADNSPIWEEFGSGWASSYAAEYDPDDAGLYYGGCPWDNRAMFDFTGHPLPSLNVFKYLRYGSTAPLAIDDVPEAPVTLMAYSKVVLPENVGVIYNDRSANTQMPVTWDAEQVAAISTEAEGVYVISGALEDGTPASCRVEIRIVNLVPNPGFEGEDRSMWKITYEGSNPTDYQVEADGAYAGSVAFHFGSADSDMVFAIEQELTDLEPGVYLLRVCAQGGDMAADAEMALYAVAGGKELTAPFMVAGRGNWQVPTIERIKVTDGTLTIGARFKCNAKSWGTLDEFTLIKVADP